MTMIGRFLLVALSACTCASAEPEVRLRIQTRPQGLAFQLDDAEATAGPWLLQHSPDGRGWKDLVFFADAQNGAEPPRIQIEWGALPMPQARKGYFRALQSAQKNPLLQRLLDERIKWRLLSTHGYRYKLRQNFGQISWHGNVIVTNNKVSSFETIDLQPPVVNVPEVPTIDSLFDRISAAIAANAAAINVVWHPIYGFPTSCFIDRELLLADEESGWSIDVFTPTR